MLRLLAPGKWTIRNYVLISVFLHLLLLLTTRLFDAPRYSKPIARKEIVYELVGGSAQEGFPPGSHSEKYGPSAEKYRQTELPLSKTGAGRCPPESLENTVKSIEPEPYPPQENSSGSLQAAVAFSTDNKSNPSSLEDSSVSPLFAEGKEANSSSQTCASSTRLNATAIGSNSSDGAQMNSIGVIRHYSAKDGIIYLFSYLTRFRPEFLPDGPEKNWLAAHWKNQGSCGEWSDNEQALEQLVEDMERRGLDSKQEMQQALLALASMGAYVDGTKRTAYRARLIRNTMMLHGTFSAEQAKNEVILEECQTEPPQLENIDRLKNRLAIDLLNKTDMHTALIHRSFGNLFILLQKSDDAESELNNGVKILESLQQSDLVDEELALTRLTLAGEYIASAKYSEARDLLMRVRNSINRKNWPGWINALCLLNEGELEFKEGRSNEAKAVYEKLLAVIPSSKSDQKDSIWYQISQYTKTRLAQP